jgi:hypothetical protein
MPMACNKSRYLFIYLLNRLLLLKNIIAKEQIYAKTD